MASSGHQGNILIPPMTKKYVSVVILSSVEYTDSFGEAANSLGGHE